MRSTRFTCFCTAQTSIFQQNFQQFLTKIFAIRERCKGVHCVDLGESVQTSIYLQNLASIQPRTSHLIFIILAASRDLIFTERSSPPSGPKTPGGKRLSVLSFRPNRGHVFRRPRGSAAKLAACQLCKQNSFFLPLRHIS